MSTQYCLRVIRLEGLRWDYHFHSKVPDLYVKVELDDVSRKTRTIRKSTSPTWNEELIFPCAGESSIFKFRIKHDSSWLSNPCVGHLDVSAAELQKKCANGEASVTLFSLNQSEPVSMELILDLSLVDPQTGIDISIKVAVEDIQRPEIGATLAMTNSINGVTSQVNSQGDLYTTIGVLLTKLDIFREAIDALSGIHPFLSAAWSLTSALYKAVQNVFETDLKIIALVRAMDDAFSFARDVQSLPNKALSLQRPLEGLLNQTVECCLFVRKYTSRRFVGRMLDADSRQKVDQFQNSLDGFKREIDSGVVLNTALVTLRTSEKVDDLILRQRLNPVLNDAFDRPVCLPDTRVEIRRHIIDWMFSETSQNVFWLHGVAGSGKSTISTTIGEYFRNISHLGAFLFFQRGKSEPSSVIRTIAYKLALFDSSIGSSILSELDNDKDIAAASSAQQFNKLLMRPLSAVATSLPGPIIIILDALDECGSADTRGSLMELFRREMPRLPNTFRFLITSRREADIDKALSSLTDSVCTMELDYASEASQRDVLSYLRTEMHNVIADQVEIPEDWPWEDNMSLLAKSAGGLFVWASTAVKMIKNSDNPFYELDCLVSDSRSLTGFGMDELYGTILRGSGVAWESKRSRDRFEKVMALLLLSKAPLTSKTIDSILSFRAQETSLLVLTRLRSVLTYSPGGPVSLFHSSFSDYLMSSDRSDDPWRIDIPAAKCALTQRCFSIMKSMLRINICGLETSFVRNDDVPGLPERIKSCIPPHLEYACLHWSHHLIDIPYSAELVGELSEFTYQRLLFWFEVLSLLKVFARIARRAILDAAAWTKVYATETASFLQDAGELVTAFAFAITQSAPHIYISMIPITKGNSEVSAHFAKQMTSTVQVKMEGIKRPPVYLKVFEGQLGTVTSVAFLPDGTRVASASSDLTVRVWDLDSGEEAFAPLTGHESCVESISVSPDGRRIVSGSLDGALMVWDVVIGQLLRGPLKEHSGGIYSVTFSSSGEMIASASADKTIVVWDANDYTTLAEPFLGHTDTIRSIAFSPDSTQIVSGSVDKTIRIWSVKSGELNHAPLEGHRDGVNSVAFSPDNEYIVSGSSDNTVRIWEVKSRSVVSIFDSHRQHVTSVAYLPNGTSIVSGSYDKTIIVWDVESGKIISGPLEGHVDMINSISVSQDGTRIVSGSFDETVRIWDVWIPMSDSGLFAGHRNAIKSVTFSVDGTRISSASDDYSVMTWDAESGDLIGPPLNHSSVVSGVAVLPNNSHLVTGSWDRLIRVWNLETGELVSDSMETQSPVSCIALSPNGRIAVCGDNEGEIRVWNIESGQLIAGPLRDHSSLVAAITFSYDGKRIASGSWDSKINIWDAESWKTVSEPLNGHTFAVSSVHFSPDKTRLVSSSYDGSVIVWNTESRQIVNGPFWHAQAVWTVLFFVTGEYVISGSADLSIRVWSVQRGQSVLTLEGGHASAISSLALSPGGSRIASGSLDNTVRCWDVSDLLRHLVQSEDRSAIVASSSNSVGFSDWIVGESGWVLGGHERRNLLLWIPPDLRRTLWRPRNTAVFSCEFSTELDFADAALGEQWTKCFNPA